MIIICISTNGTLLVNCVIYKHQFVVTYSRGTSAFELIFKCLKSVIGTTDSTLTSPGLRNFYAYNHQFQMIKLDKIV